MDEHMLTTVDNPYDPFTMFDEWYAHDCQAGYNTMQFLARVARTSHDLSDADHDAAIEAAMVEIVKENVLGLYRLVSKSDFESTTA